MPILNGFCCGCKVGETIPSWVNVTMVRPIGDTLPANYTSAPYQRWDVGWYNDQIGPPNCDALSGGTCGPWLVIGDANGLSAQAVSDGTDDIKACVAPDSTHVTSDHNCYSYDGTSTVSMRQTKAFGGQWVLCKKFWHGVFGLQSLDVGTVDPANDPDQTKYLQNTIVMSGTASNNVGSGSYLYSSYYDNSQTRTVDRYSGIITLSGVTSDSGVSESTGGVPNPDAEDVFFQNDMDLVGFTAGIQFLNGVFVLPTSGGSFASAVNVWQGTHGVITTAAEFQDFLANTNLSAYTEGLTRTATCSFTDTSFSFSWGESGTDPDDPTGTESISWTASITLSSPYTAQNCYDDGRTLLAAWDMSDMNLASLRTDEELANAPLVVFDEVNGAVSPGYWSGPGTMDDLRSPIADANGNAPWTYAYGGVSPGTGWTEGSSSQTTTWTPTFTQMTWIDPNNYIWKFAYGGYNKPIYYGSGVTLLTGFRVSGQIKAHNQAGSGRHFWFGFHEFYRYEFTDPSTGVTSWLWSGYKYGGSSDGNLPAVTLRWMNKLEAQFDSALVGTPPQANFPQAFINQYNGRLVMGKYLAATQKWNAVNFGRPCGPDKFAVDQLTVCCVMSGDAASGWTVQETDGANNPLATGGLSVGNYIVVGGVGIFKIGTLATTTASGEGYAQWLVTPTTTSPIDTLPTGFQMNDTGNDGSGYLGALRWPTHPGICGRAAATATYASGTLTITSATAQMFLRMDPTTGNITVDLYDAAMDTGSKIASVVLTRVSDTVFTAAMGSAPGITVAWMVGAGVDYTKYSSASQKTGVVLEWAFNQRQAQSGYPSPPTWYADVAGCLSCTVTQFNYGGTACPVMVGIVPNNPATGSPVETVPTGSMLTGFPATPVFDDIYGYHWQKAVMLTMVDPFYQQPFKPDCNQATPAQWIQDDGTGQTDDTDSTPQVWYFPHAPLVEALATIPSGDSLPAGTFLTFDTTATVIPPPYYTLQSGGIPTSLTGNGEYESIETDWGFASRACATIGSSGRFSSVYMTFVSC